MPQEGPGSPSIIVCCSDMLCDLTGVNDAFPHGFYWDDFEGQPLRLYEWLSGKEGDEREIERCCYCERVPLTRRGPTSRGTALGKKERRELVHGMVN